MHYTCPRVSRDKTCAENHHTNFKKYFRIAVLYLPYPTFLSVATLVSAIFVDDRCSVPSADDPFVQGMLSEGEAGNVEDGSGDGESGSGDASETSSSSKPDDQEESEWAEGAVPLDGLKEGVLSCTRFSAVAAGIDSVCLVREGGVTLSPDARLRGSPLLAINVIGVFRHPAFDCVNYNIHENWGLAKWSDVLKSCSEARRSPCRMICDMKGCSVPFRPKAGCTLTVAP